MKRREFITLLGGAAAAWPLPPRAQQRVRRVGVLMGLDENDPEGKAQLFGFTKALEDLGWIDGRNARLDVRWGGGNVDHARLHRSNGLRTRVARWNDRT
jgi:putative ABC transport system substrate-binding protein